MKFKRSESLYLAMSLALLVLIFGLFVYTKHSNKPVKGGDVEVAPRYISSTSSSSSSSQSNKNVEADLEALENNPSVDKLNSLQDEIDQVSNKSQKAAYQERFNIVSAKLALANAQANPTADNIQLAQGAIDKVTTTSKKSDLQSQLDALSQPAQTGLQ